MTYGQGEGQSSGPWAPPQYDAAAHQRRLQGPAQEAPGQLHAYPQGGYGQQHAKHYRPLRKRHIARNIFAGIGAAVVAVIVIAVAASGNHHTIQTAGSAGRTGAGQAHVPSAKTAGIGTAITLTGNDNGEQMAVTVTKVIADAKGTDEFNQAPAGDRLYAVQFRLTDTGSADYSDSPSNGTAVVDSKGQSYEPGIESVAGCQEFPGSENIAAGASGLGCIVFEVPRAAVITRVQFTLNSGFGPQTGQWDVAGKY